MSPAGGLVITAGDRLVARRFDDREVAWEVLMRGARLAMPPSRAWIAATDGIELVTLDFEGKPRKRIARPVSVGEGEVLELVVDESTAYVVFGKRDIAAELVALDLVP